MFAMIEHVVKVMERLLSWFRANVTALSNTLTTPTHQLTHSKCYNPLLEM